MTNQEYYEPGAENARLIFNDEHDVRWSLWLVVPDVPPEMRVLNLEVFPSDLYPWTDVPKVVDYVESRLKERYSVIRQIDMVQREPGITTEWALTELL
jgi:hypothetical protein